MLVDRKHPVFPSDIRLRTRLESKTVKRPEERLVSKYNTGFDGKCYSYATTSRFDVDQFARYSHFIAFLLTRYAVLVRKVNFGQSFLHNLVDIGTAPADDVRMCGEAHFHRHLDRVELHQILQKYLKFIELRPNAISI